MSDSELTKILQSKLTISTPDLLKINAFLFYHETGTVLGYLWTRAQMLEIGLARDESIDDIKDSLYLLKLWREWIYRHQDREERIEARYLFADKPIGEGKTILEGIGYLSEDIMLAIEQTVYSPEDKLNDQLKKEKNRDKKSGT